MTVSTRSTCTPPCLRHLTALLPRHTTHDSRHTTNDTHGRAEAPRPSTRLDQTAILVPAPKGRAFAYAPLQQDANDAVALVSRVSSGWAKGKSGGSSEMLPLLPVPCSDPPLLNPPPKGHIPARPPRTSHTPLYRPLTMVPPLHPPSPALKIIEPRPQRPHYETMAAARTSSRRSLPRCW